MVLACGMGSVVALAAALFPERDAEAELWWVGNSSYLHGDKFGPHAKHEYHHIYAQHLAPIRHKNLTFLEIGLGCNMPKIKVRGDGIGRSVALWRNYLPHATLWWAEQNGGCVEKRWEQLKSAGVHGVVKGDQGDPKVLAQWLKEINASLDFIIDDGGHTSAMQWTTLTGLWPGLSPGGKLVIEDMGFSRVKGQHIPNPQLGVPATMLEITLELLTDIVEHGTEIASHTNQHNNVSRPSRLRRYLPGLETIQCYAEACVFVKGIGNSTTLYAEQK